MNTEHEISCGAVLYRKNQAKIEYLLIQQIQGHYTFPKGHQEAKESYLATAIREIKEETHLMVQFDPYFCQKITYCPKPNVTKDVYYFLATPIAGNMQRQIEEVKWIGWVDEQTALHLLSHDSMKKVFIQAVDYIKRMGV